GARRWARGTRGAAGARSRSTRSWTSGSRRSGSRSSRGRRTEDAVGQPPPEEREDGLGVTGVVAERSDRRAARNQGERARLVRGEGPVVNAEVLPPDQGPRADEPRRRRQDERQPGERFWGQRLHRPL